MLTITQGAATLLAQQRAEFGAPESYGVRISAPDPEADTPNALVLAFVPAPLPGDAVTEQVGLRAFVAADVSRRLDDAILDATPHQRHAAGAHPAAIAAASVLDHELIPEGGADP